MRFISVYPRINLAFKISSCTTNHNFRVAELSIVLIGLYGITIVGVSYETAFSASTLPEYLCKMAKSEIVIDGMLNEDTWQDVAVLSPFQLWNGTREAKDRTEVRVLRDADNLLMGFKVDDKDIWAIKSVRDDILCEDEVVEFFIDAKGSSDAYIELEINALNAIFDLYVSRSKGEFKRWNLKELETAIYVNGTLDNRKDEDKWWSCEIKIPFYNFVLSKHIPPEKGDVWKLNVYRIEGEGKSREYSAWSPTYTKTPNFHVPERFGRLVFE